MTVAGCTRPGGGPSAQVTSSTSPPPLDRPLNIVATTPQLLEFTRVIAGNAATARSIVKAGVDPRRYELTADDITVLTNADMIIQNGLGLEPWFEEWSKSGEQRGTVVAANTGVQTRRSADGTLDPYIWMSPSNARVMVSNISAALVDADPANESVYLGNERAYASQLDGVINYAQQALRLREGTHVGTIDEPLAYFCDEFNLQPTDFILKPFDPAAGPSDADVAAIVQTLNRDKPKILFISEAIPPRASLAIRTGTGIPVASGEIHGETLGLRGNAGNANYVAMMRNTTDVVASAIR
jgi:ABC-type Zn uptake system ZnuABC Zn-binding protein ZnuA